MSSQLISIIVPVHNAAQTLEAAVHSALRQREIEQELLLVDDGAEDGSGELCERFAAADGRIRVFHMEDLGVSAARNLGLEKARGTRITFLDADDVLHPDMLALLDGMLDETGAAYAGCGFERREGSAVPFGETMQPQRTAGNQETALEGVPGGSGAGKSDAAADPEECLSAGGGVSCRKSAVRNHRELRGTEILTGGILRPDHPDTRIWSKLFRRDYIGDCRFREGLSIGEDFLFLTQLVQEDTRYVFTEEPYYSYYVNPNGAMERPFAPNHMDHLRCWEYAEEEICMKFPELLTESDNASRLAAQHLIAAVLTASKISRLPAAQQRQYEREFELCRERIRRYSGVKGARQYLPQGYALKIQMLLHTPGVYRRLYH